jgi:adenosine deaminase
VLEAAALGATRIGHGVNIMRGETAAQSAAWVDRARALGLHFEVCPSSNVHTGAVASLAEHPIGRMMDAGLAVSCSTDNRLMSSVTLSDELQALHAVLAFDEQRLGALMRSAAEASFLPAAARADALRAMQQWDDRLATDLLSQPG